MKRTIRDHEWTREPTPVTVEERYDDGEIPPLPPPPTVIYQTRVPWLRIIVLMFAVALLVETVVYGLVRR